MKLRSLQLKNFRSHADTKIELDHVNIFVGAGGAGKSSIKAAIEYLLTGRCQWTDKSGKGADELIRDGAKKASIIADMSSLGKVVRHIPNALEIQAHNGSLTVLQETIYRILKADKDVISAMLNTDKFIEMTPDEQKKMLFALLGFKFNKETVRQALYEFLQKNGYKDIEKDVMNLFDFVYPDGLSGGSEVLDSLDKLFRDERKDAKKALERTRTLALNNRESLLPEGVSVHDKDEIEKQLAELKQRKEEIQVQLKQSAAANQRDALAKRVETNRQELSVAEKQLNSIPQNNNLEELENNLVQLSEKIKQAKKKEEAAQKKFLEAEGEVKGLAKAMGAIYDSGEDCPLAPGLVKCTMSKTEKDKLLEDMDGNLTKLKAARSKASKALEAAQKVVKELKEEYEQATASYERAKEANRECEKLENNIKSLAKQISEDEMMLKGLPEPVDTSALQAEIEHLESRIPRGEKLLQAIIAEKNARDEQAKYEDEADHLAMRVEILEVLVKAFSPKGIKAEKLTGVVKKLQQKANERLLMLTNSKYHVAFDTSDDFEIRVTKTGSAPRKATRLSTSEIYRVGLIMQSILNDLTGLGILIFDNAEALDAEARLIMTQTLLQLKDDFETIMVFSTRGDIAPRNPGIPGLKMFEVVDGTVREIPPEKEGAVA